MEKQLKLFFEFLENEKKLSNNTLQSYKRDLKQFRRYIEGCEVAYTKVDEEVMQNYIEYLEELGKKYNVAPASIATSFLLMLGDNIQVITGSTNKKQIKESIDGCSVKLTKE